MGRCRTIRTCIAVALGALLASCGAWNQPINTPLSATSHPIQEPDFGARSKGRDDLVVALAFSGGGTRASSFSYGMLKALRAATATPQNPDGLLSHVRMVTGVSGGSVTAAYYGLYGPRGLDRYRDNYLIQNAEQYMATNVLNPLTLSRGLSGGANNRKTFSRFLNESIFKNATFGDMWKRGHATTWLNATDIANSTPFLFSQETFDAICSDLSRLPVSEAVAASAAFPLVFSPITLAAHSDDCDYSEPDWLTAARFNPESTSALRAYGASLETYRDPDKVKYIKLLDGAITDNFGTTGFSVARAKAQNPFGPLTEAQAVKLTRMLVLVANAGVQQDPRWNQKVGGPGGVGLGLAIANASMGAATRVGYDVMRLTLDEYAADLIEWRCDLPAARVRALRGSTAGWDCADVKFFVGQVAFDVLDPDQRDKLNEVPTRLALPTDQVDLVIAAGEEATRRNPDLNGFLRAIDANPAAGGPAPRRIIPNNARRITPSN